MALLFVINLATRLETAAVNTTETVTIRDIATDPSLTADRQTGFAIDISSTFASPNISGSDTQNHTGYYQMQTVKNGRFDASHSFPGNFNYNARINAAFSNNPTSNAYGYQFNLSGLSKEGLQDIYG
jgi:hypothetical protein